MRKSLISSILLAPLAAGLLGAKPYDLTVGEGFTDPLGFHDATPAFSWKLEPGVIKQTAYQLQVTGDATWDSGWVDSDQSVFVPYAGPALQSRQKVDWRVRYRDHDDKESAWSAAGRVEFGLLGAEEWSAKWIRPSQAGSAEAAFKLIHAVYRSKGKPDSGKDVTQLLRKGIKDGTLTVNVTNEALGGDPAFGEVKELELTYVLNGKETTLRMEEGKSKTIPDNEHSRERVAYLRRDFELSREIKQARLYATARGLFELTLNDERVGVDYFVPGWTPYKTRIETLTYDVTNQLKRGSNRIQSALGSGWFAGVLGMEKFREQVHYGTQPELLLQLEIEYADGSTERMVTDENWQGTFKGPVITSSIYDGEVYDARIPVSKWGAVIASDLDQVELVPKAFPPVRKRERLATLEINEPEPGRFVFDLGQNMVGWPRLRIPVEKDQRMTVRFAEMLNQDGTLYTENYRSAHSTNYYTAAQTGSIDWEPTFTFHGFRYVELSGLPANAKPSKDWVEGVVLYSDLKPIGTFESSHGKLNRLQKNIIWGQRGNFLEIPTDCPQRDERLGWTGDAQVFAPTAMFNYDCHAFFKSWLRSMREEQRPSGHVPNVIPAVVTDGASVGWHDAATIIPWVAYVRTGDIDFLSENLAMMEKLVGWYRNRSKSGLVGKVSTFGDWLQPYAKNGKGDTTPDYLGTAFYAYSTQILADAAGLLGRESAAAYAEEARMVKQAFTKRYFDTDGRLKDTGETQTAYVLAIAFDLLPDDLRGKSVVHLERLVDAAEGHLRTGFLGTPHLNRALDDMGCSELALSVLFKETYPSWFYSINQGATTMWERWNSYTHEDGFGDAKMNSFNHYAYGAIGQWMYERLAGLEPDPAQPGYKHFFVRPLIAPQLEFARAELDTPYGKAASAWRKDRDKVVLNVTVPPNSSATIYLPPGTNPSTIRVNAEPASQAGGITKAEMQDGLAVLNAVAGSYQIEAMYD